VVAVTAGVVDPRYPTFKGIMQAKSKPIESLTIADLDVELANDQTIVGVSDVPARSGGEIIEDEGEAFERIVSVLEEVKVI
jgi:electron transfer flavoprotein beta subunit